MKTISPGKQGSYVDIPRGAVETAYSYTSRQLRNELKTSFNGAGWGTGARIVDFGCGSSPYRDLLPVGIEFLGADLPGNPYANIAINANGTLPLPDNDCHGVLSTQVLEHVQDPAQYLRECCRVLKPGASLILSTHGIWRYHPDPIDLWRWTSEGLTYSLHQSGLEVVRISGVIGLAAASLQLIQDDIFHKLPKILRPAFNAIWQKLIALADRLNDDSSRVRNAVFYVVHARKRNTQ